MTPAHAPVTRATVRVFGGRAARVGSNRCRVVQLSVRRPVRRPAAGSRPGRRRACSCCVLVASSRSRPSPAAVLTAGLLVARARRWLACSVCVAVLRRRDVVRLRRRRLPGPAASAAPACGEARWKDVEDVDRADRRAASAACVLRLRDGRTTTIPVGVLAGQRRRLRARPAAAPRPRPRLPAAAPSRRLSARRRPDPPIRPPGGRPVACAGCLEVSPSGLWRPPAKRVEGYPLSRVQIPPPPPDPTAPARLSLCRQRVSGSLGASTAVGAVAPAHSTRASATRPAVTRPVAPVGASGDVRRRPGTPRWS